MREASWCFDDSTTGPFTNSGCTFETVSPLRGAASAKVDCSQIQTFSWTLNPNRQVLYWAARFKFSNPGLGCSLVKWTDYNSQVADLRLADDGKIYLAIDDIPKAQSRRTVLADTEFHLQGEVYFTSFILVRTKFNNRQLFDLNYGPVTQPAGIIQVMDFGSFLGTGSGTCLIDDVVINNSDQFTRKDYGYPGNWTGRIDRPNAAGTFQAWDGSLGSIIDSSDATFISTSTNGAKASYSFPAITVPAGRNVLKAANYLVRARSDITPRLRIGIRKTQPAPSNEKLLIFFDPGSASGGVFQVSFNSNITTEIAFDASILDIEAALEALPDIGIGNVTVSVDTQTGGWFIEFVGRLAGEAMPPFYVGGSGFGDGVNINLQVVQKGNENFFYQAVGELWWFIAPYVQPVIEPEFSNLQYHSLLKPDTHSIWSRLTLAEFQILLERFEPEAEAAIEIPVEELPITPAPPEPPPPPLLEIVGDMQFPFLNYEGASVPKNGDGAFYPNQGAAGVGTVSLSTDAMLGSKSLKLNLTSGSMGLQFNPYNYGGQKSGVLSPRGFAREYADNPVGWQFNAYNRLSFWIKAPTNGAAAAVPGSTNVHFGTYVKRVSNPDLNSDEAGGNHYYHHLNISPTGTWTKVILNMHPSHQRDGGGDTEWGVLAHPTGEAAYNYWDALTRFYLDTVSFAASGVTPYLFDGFVFYQESGENDNQVYSISATSIPSQNRVILTWCKNKNESVLHEVRYAFQHISSWETAIPAPGGTITPPGSGGYNGMVYNTTGIPIAGQSVLYLAIKPQNSSLYSQISIPLASPSPPPPAFVLPPAGQPDFRLLPGSPALNAGTTTSVTTDIRGRSRDASPSVGAYEGEY